MVHGVLGGEGTGVSPSSHSLAFTDAASLTLMSLVAWPLCFLEGLSAHLRKTPNGYRNRKRNPRGDHNQRMTGALLESQVLLEKKDCVS